MIPFPPFAPDRSIHAPDATSVVLNAKPVADGWGPLPSLATFTNALAAEPKGAISAVLADGNVATFVGTTTHLYKLNSDGSWSDVSHTTYAVPTGYKWSFAVFGNTVLATNETDGLLKYTVGSDSAFSAVSGAPAARYVMVVGDFVVQMALASDTASLQWSELNNYAGWTVGDAFSDVQAFPDGGEIMGGVPVQGGAIILQRALIRAMRFDPASGYTFSFQVANESRGCIAPNAIVSIGPSDFIYISQEGFFRGVQGVPIGAERVDRTFLTIAELSDVEQAEGAADPFEKVAWFRFKKKDGNDALWGYDWQLDRWFESDAEITGFGVFAQSSVSIDELDAIYGDLDSIPVSLDSFIGGKPKFGAFNRDYEFGYLDGSAQVATLETPTIEHFPPMRAFVRGVQVVGDLGAATLGTFDGGGLTVEEISGSGDSYFTGNFTVQVGSADYHGTEIDWSSSFEPNRFTGITHFRKSGRLHRYRIVTSSGSTWNHIIGVRSDAVKEGNR